MMRFVYSFFAVSLVYLIFVISDNSARQYALFFGEIVIANLVFTTLMYVTLTIGRLYLESLRKFQNYEYLRHKRKIKITIIIMICVCADVIFIFFEYSFFYACYGDLLFNKMDYS